MRIRRQSLALFFVTVCVLLLTAAYLLLPSLVEQLDKTIRNRLSLQSLQYQMEHPGLTSVVLQDIRLEKEVAGRRVIVHIPQAELHYSWRMLLGRPALAIGIPGMALQWEELETTAPIPQQSDPRTVLLLLETPLPQLDVRIDSLSLRRSSDSSTIEVKDIRLALDPDETQLSCSLGPVFPAASAVEVEALLHRSKKQLSLELALSSGSRASFSLQVGPEEQDALALNLLANIELQAGDLLIEETAGEFAMRADVRLPRGMPTLQILKGSSASLTQFQTPYVAGEDVRTQVEEQLLLDLQSERYFVDGSLLLQAKHLELHPELSLLAGELQLAFTATKSIPLRAEEVQLRFKDKVFPRFAAEVQLKPQTQPIDLQFSLTSETPRLKAEGRLQLPRGEKTDIPALKLELKGQPIKSLQQLLETVDLLPDYGLVFSEGLVTAAYSISSFESPKPRLSLSLKEVAGKSPFFLFSGLEGAIAFTSLPRLDSNLASIRVAQLDFGIPLEDINARFSLQERTDGLRLQIARAQLAFAGGRLRNENGSYSFARQQGAIAVRVEDIALSELLRLYPQEAIQAEGRLSGILPLQIDGSEFTLDAGHLQSSQGLLQLQDSLVQALGARLGELATALEHYQYSELQSAATLEKNGNLELKLSLKGKNPEFQSGRPLHLNLTIEEHLPTLIRSIRIGRNLSEFLGKDAELRSRQEQ